MIIKWIIWLNGCYVPTAFQRSWKPVDFCVSKYGVKTNWERLEQPNLPLTVERMLREESPPSCPRDGFRSPTSTFLHWWTKVPKFCSHEWYGRWHRKGSPTWEVIKFPEKLTRFGGSPEMERPPVLQRCLLVRQFIVLLRLIYFVNSALRPMSDFVSWDNTE